MQIQPVFRQKEDYSAFAEKEDLSFEVLELLPPLSKDPQGLFYRNCGRVTSVHGAFIDVNPASGDPLLRDLSVRRCEDSCISALFCGAKNVILHSSCFPFLRGGYLDNWVAKCSDVYSELAAKYDLNIYIENSMDLDPGPIRELMNRISDRRVMVCLDIGHANYSRVPVKGWFDELGDRIGYLHLSDNMGQYDDHITLGRGVIDWEEASALAAYLPEDTPMTIEVSGLDNIMESLNYLRERRLFRQ